MKELTPRQRKIIDLMNELPKRDKLSDKVVRGLRDMHHPVANDEENLMQIKKGIDETGAQSHS